MSEQAADRIGEALPNRPLVRKRAGSALCQPVDAPGEGPLTEHITATQAQPPERGFLPQSRLSWGCPVTAESGGNATFPISPECNAQA